MEDEAHWLVSDGKVKAHGLRGTSLDKTMTFGEAGSAFAFAILAFLSVIVAAKAYTPEYAFHAYLFAAASAPLRRLFWASAAPWRHSARHGALLGAALLGALAAGAFLSGHLSSWNFWAVAASLSEHQQVRRIMGLTYAIGDIHGRHDLLQMLLQEIGEHAEVHPRKLVFLGDYIDRGPDSAAVIDTVRSVQARSWGEVVCLKGNHESMLLEVIERPDLVPWWIDNGGDATLASFGAASTREIAAEVLDWLGSLPTSHEDERRYYVHAGLMPGWRFEDQTEKHKIWIREPFLGMDYDFGKHVVHGHTPLASARPEVRPFRTNLDTAAVFGGALTAGIFTDEQGPPVGFLQAA